MKTAEQAAKRYADTQCMDGTAYKAFLAGATWAERWIPVEEELPPSSDEDLLLKGIDDRGVHGIVDIGYMHEPGTSANNFISLGGTLVKVTHWRPIEHK